MSAKTDTDGSSRGCAGDRDNDGGNRVERSPGPTGPAPRPSTTQSSRRAWTRNQTPPQALVTAVSARFAGARRAICAVPCTWPISIAGRPARLGAARSVVEDRCDRRARRVRSGRATAWQAPPTPTAPGRPSRPSRHGPGRSPRPRPFPATELTTAASGDRVVAAARAPVRRVRRCAADRDSDPTRLATAFANRIQSSTRKTARQAVRPQQAQRGSVPGAPAPRRPRRPLSA